MACHPTNAHNEAKMKINPSIERFRVAFGDLMHRATHLDSEAAHDREGHGEPEGGARTLPSGGENRLADPHGLFDLLANSLPHLIFYIDAREICCAHNVAVQRVLGLAPAQITSRPLHEILGAASYECIKSWVERALAGEEVFLRQVHRDPKGKILAFDARYVPHLGADRQILGFCAVLTPSASLDSVKPPAVEGQDDRNDSGASINSSDTDRFQVVARESVSLDMAARNDALLRFTAALQSDAFCLFQQAIVPIEPSASAPRCYEVLIRLRNEEQRLVHPAAFFRIAQEVGFMRQLDRWVVERVLRWCSKQCADGKLLPASFHLNLSSDSIGDESFLAFLRLILAKHDLPADTLCFEIGEADLVGHRLEVMSCAHALRMLGCRVALDRFRGVSGSFSALLDLPIDWVKIDGSIVGALLTDRQSQMKARIVSKLAQSGRVRTIAEHVEDAETLEMLRRIGIDYVQGFGIAMPEPLEDLKIRAGENEECLRPASG
ncbi:MAG: EAL domain-containing protein [Betaproteobacteria bacterium]|nr:EAL domain-containing protein [Betaproteobacteria bacterium]